MANKISYNVILFGILTWIGVSDKNCVFTGYSHDGTPIATLDLSSLQGTILTHDTSPYIYTYGVCDDSLKCDGSHPNHGMFLISNNTGFCQVLGTFDPSIDPFYHESTKTFQFIFSNGATSPQCNGISRLYWICNPDIDTYKIVYGGAECVCCFGMNIESKLACDTSSLISDDSKDTSKDNSKHNNDPTPCSSEYDCSYNGKCISGYCNCKPQWKGPHCAQLNVLPTTKDAGYQGMTSNGERISSWGGSIAKDSEGNWHMYAAQMDGGGIFIWRANSILIHAQLNGTKNGVGKYEYVSTIKGVWSHEPSVSISPNNETVIYWTNSPTPNGGNPQISPCKGVKNGMTLDCDLQQLFIGDDTPTVMSYSQNPDGPWSPIEIIPTQNPYGYDSCLSSYIYKNGSFIGIFDSDDGFYIEYADDWRDNSTYKFHFIDDMPPVGEDPYIWVDTSNNVVHAVFHGIYIHNTHNIYHM